MTDDPRTHQYNDADWQYEIDTVQRSGLTAATLSRRHGDVSYPDATDGEEPHDQHEDDKGGFDRDRIPTGI